MVTSESHFLFSFFLPCGVSLLALSRNHWHRQCEEDGQVFFSLDDGATKFTDLIQLVEFYQLNRGVLPCKLKHPCTVVALWHLRIIWPHDPYHLTWLPKTNIRTVSWFFLFYLYKKLVNWLMFHCLYCHESAGDCWLVGFLLVCIDVWAGGCTTCSQGSTVKKRKEKGNEHCRLCQCCCKIFHNLATHSHQ